MCCCKLEFGEFAAMHECKSNMIEFEAKGHECMLESSELGASLHETPLRRGAGASLGRRAARRRVRPARDKRAEVVSDSFASLFDCCESPSTRFHRVTILHDNLGFSPLACSPARNSQSGLARDTDLHGGVSLNSANLVGDMEAW